MTVSDSDLIRGIERDFSTERLDFIQEVLVWDYSCEDYSGNAYLLYRDSRDGLLYEVHGSHCSCYGLEDQFSPEKVSTKRLKMWLDTMKDDREHNESIIKQLEKVLPTLEDQSGL